MTEPTADEALKARVDAYIEHYEDAPNWGGPTMYPAPLKFADIKALRQAAFPPAADAGEVQAPSPTFEDGGWESIETAPRDGTDVLLFTDTQASDTVSMRIYLHTGGEHFTAVQIGFWEDAVDAPMRKERAGWRKDKIGEPTHWRPLPAPPAELGE